MSYIINSNNPFVSIKLTQIGREAIALGKLNFSYWGIGDSEINYEREAIVDANSNDITLSGASKILRPFDKQPTIKYFIKPSTTNLNLQAINSANMNVIKAIVNNEATERGFFTHDATGFTTTLSSTLTPYNQPILNTALTGSTRLVLSSTTNVTVGDFILLKVSNSKIGNINPSGTTIAIPNLWFKIQGLTGTTIELDRNTPNYSGDSSLTQAIVYKGGEVYQSIATGNTTAYWDSGTLSFNSSVNVTCNDVPVWNMNNVWCENMAGMSGSTLYENFEDFGSYQYLGTKNPFLEYFCTSSANTNSNFNCNGPGISYPDDVSKSISIIHYTNNTISSLYGEFLYVDATNDKIVQLHLPNLMYHRFGSSTGSGTTMGMTFIASGETKTIGDSDIEYIDLIEHPSLISSANTNTLVVGKVLPDLKMIIIHNDEITAALSYKSNRNWTLPALSANIQAPSGGTSTGVLKPNETIYLTYSLEMSGTTGLTSSLPCQDYVKVTNNTSSAKDIVFRINETDVLPYMRKKEYSYYDGYGFTATNFKLLYQIVSDETTRPNPAIWKTYDYTSNAITVNNLATIDPKLLENQSPLVTGFVLDKLKDLSATTFNLIPILNMAPVNSPSKLQFGDERFLYGNIETFIGATIYKTIFDIRINSGQFNTTSNPTRSQDPATNPPNIKVSEVGIFDSNQNLVCIGKLSKPVSLVPGNTIMLELSLDF